MRKIRASIWTLLFIFTATVLGSIIIYGMLTNDLSPRYGLYLIIEERTLPVEAVEGVSAQMTLKDLKTDPKLVVKTHRLPDSTPLRLWLIDVTGQQKPLLLPAKIEVNAQGKAKAEIRLPKNAIRYYGTVVGEQNRRTLFQAPLG